MIQRERKVRDFDLVQLFNNYHRIIVMGVVNTTPDSFSDGGKFLSPEVAVTHALHLVDDGADIIDIGGESSRPGSNAVDESEEIRRVLPVISQLADSCRVPISVDTTKSGVARSALEAGAVVVNDINALHGDAEMARTVAEFDAGLILMHMRGTPKDMQHDTAYDDLLSEIRDYLADAINLATRAGVNPEKIMVDPGVGFGKDLDGNLEIIRSIAKLGSLNRPVLIGASRKAFIGRITNATADDRLAGSLAAATAAVLNGATAVRVHDVRETRQAVDVAFRLRARF